MKPSIVYYSNNRLPDELQRHVLENLTRADAELICVTWQPVPVPHILWPRHVADHRNIYEQILAGIDAAHGDRIALAEHDVLYPADYFQALGDAASAGLVYNTNVWRLDRNGYFRPSNRHLLSNCGGRRSALVRGIRQKLAEAKRGVPEWAEPAADSEFAAPHPTVDIRHGRNFTGERRPRRGRYRQRIPYWGPWERYASLFASLDEGDHAVGGDVAQAVHDAARPAHLQVRRSRRTQSEVNAKIAL